MAPYNRSTKDQHERIRKALRLRMQQYEEDRASLSDIALRFGVHKSTVERLQKEVKDDSPGANNSSPGCSTGG